MFGADLTLSQFLSTIPPGYRGDQTFLEHNLGEWLTLWAKGREQEFKPQRPTPNPFPWLLQP